MPELSRGYSATKNRKASAVNKPAMLELASAGTIKTTEAFLRENPMNNTDRLAIFVVDKVIDSIQSRFDGNVFPLLRWIRYILMPFVLQVMQPRFLCGLRSTLFQTLFLKMP